MTQTNSWLDKDTVKKGNIGEDIVRDYLIKMGYVPYEPVIGIAHPFDKLCASRDKKTIFIAEVKTKARRNKYPDTGINISHYNDYKNIQTKHNIHVFLFFVDEMLKKVYGEFLIKLEDPLKIIVNGYEINYPLRFKGIIYFPIEKMRDIGDLNKQQVADLKNLSTRSYDYEVTQ